MTAAKLASALRAAGLTVKEDKGWTTRGGGWTKGKPVGVMHHHTAPPVPYPIARLNGSGDGYIKCNINTKPDGTIWLVAYEACNYSSGPGSSVVLKEVQAGKVPTANAKARGLKDNTNGNPYFWNFENDHAGNGSIIPAVQLEALAIATVVVNKHFGLQYDNVISHAEWTSRKTDPFWNKNSRCIEGIRSLVKAKETGTTPPPQPEPPVPPDKEKETMYPIKRGETSEDVKYLQARMKQMGVDAGNDGLADQDFLNKFFVMVGSPTGGSFISGAEGAIFDAKFIGWASVSFAEGDKRWAPIGHVADVKTSTPHT